MIDNHFKANDLQNFSKGIKEGKIEGINVTDTDPNLARPEFKSKKSGQEIKKNVPLAPGRKSKLSSAKKFFKFLKIGKKKKHKQSDDVANPNPNKNNSLEKQSKTGESNEGNIPVSSIESNKIESLDDKIADYTNFLEKSKKEFGDIVCLQRLNKEFEKFKANGNFDKAYLQIKEDAQKQVQAVRSFVSLIKDFEKEYGEKNIPGCFYQKLEKCKEEGKGELVYDQAKSLVENTRDYSDLIDKLKFKYGTDSVPKSLYEKLKQYRKFGSEEKISPRTKIHIENLVKNVKAFIDLVNKLKIKYGEKNIPDSVLDRLKKYKEFGREEEVSAKTIKWAKHEVLKFINKSNGACGKFVTGLEEKYGRHNIPECLYKNINEEEKISILDKTKSEAENLVKNTRDFSKLISGLEKRYGKENVPQSFYEELSRFKREGRKNPVSTEVGSKMENLVKNTKDYAELLDGLMEKYGDRNFPIFLSQKLMQYRKVGNENSVTPQVKNEVENLVKNTKDYAALVYELGQKYGWSNIPKYVLEKLETYRKVGNENSVTPQVKNEVENLVKNTKDYEDLVRGLGELEQKYGQNHIPKYMLEELEKYREEGRKDPVPQEWFDGNGWKLGDPTISDDFERLDPMYDSTHDEIENPLFNSQLGAKDYDPFDEPFDDDDM